MSRGWEKDNKEEDHKEREMLKKRGKGAKMEHPLEGMRMKKNRKGNGKTGGSRVVRGIETESRHLLEEEEEEEEEEQEEQEQPVRPTHFRRMELDLGPSWVAQLRPHWVKFLPCIVLLEETKFIRLQGLGLLNQRS
ncbi:hypothetical protein SLEP1_g3480 [Rubroshorea leprosula]|uniref:Uncharacterized protein n=1 Tax=Rubroshorea leprosula TaxID=152421 RepID=A0AAV5HTT0_9ROSI|nr:hypothetical protein SLEP1_g3480 [Rubroshorea leprosula]